MSVRQKAQKSNLFLRHLIKCDIKDLFNKHKSSIEPIDLQEKSV